jgi:glucosyl-3-phosphoglycerate synthase
MPVPPVVEAWSAYRTGSAAQWTPRQLVRAKKGTGISVVIPARDEEATVGAIVATIREHLMRRYPLVDELIVVDSRSRDATATVAAAAGATVVSQDAMTRGLPRLDGKGDALWAGLAAAGGDLVAFVDADLRKFQSHFLTGLLGPLLTDPSVAFVKGFYHRPLVGSGESPRRPDLRSAHHETKQEIEPDGGGRVTELVARPLLNMFWPQLAGFVQPLAGEYAGRRAVLEQVPFVSGYGVEIAMLVDLLELVGLDALAQVDLGERLHRHQNTDALGRMAAQIMLTVWARLRRLGWADPTMSPATVLTQFRRGGGAALPNLDREIVVNDVAVDERPPLARLRMSGVGPHRSV